MDGRYEYLKVLSHLFHIGFVGCYDKAFIFLSMGIEPLLGIVDNDLVEKVQPLFGKPVKYHAVPFR
jgi:hypothetical protein